AGKRIQAWTLEWDEDAGVLRKMRSKETEDDYRYFREPDLLPVRVTEEWKQAILRDLPELPLERRQRFASHTGLPGQYGLPEYDAEILTSERGLSDYFEAVVKAYNGDPKRVSNWLMNDVLRMLNDAGLTAGQLKLTPAYLADLIKLVDAGTISVSTGKTLLEKVQASGKSPAEIVQAEGLAKVSDDAAIRAVCEQVLAESPNEVASYKAGKVTLMGWFVGQVMKKMRGKADPQLARQILEKLLA
ncbi:MAG: Asp-tRNA(Asn)/Glu-tRNA(Gln) amidotransferase GatCAB subunit B, partial [Anaerolineaceae bacterium]